MTLIKDLGPHIERVKLALKAGTATIHCPACGSTDIRQVTVATAYDCVDAWYVDVRGSVEVDDSTPDSNVEWEVDTERPPYICGDCLGDRYEIGDLDVRIDGEPVPLGDAAEADDPPCDGDAKCKTHGRTNDPRKECRR